MAPPLTVIPILCRSSSCSRGTSFSLVCIEASLFLSPDDAPVSSLQLGSKFDQGRVLYQQVDLDDEQQLLAAIQGADLVVHTAGPFQGLSTPKVLDAALRLGVPYVDVCDEKLLCEAATARQETAARAGVAAIVSAGIWPGSSALLAAACCDALRLGGSECEELDMSFYTAGTGNAGATIV